MFKLNTVELELRMKLAQATPQDESDAGVVATRPKVHDPIFDLIQEAIKASCTIFVKSGRRQWTGSGFHIGGGYIATASHVAPPDLQNSGAQISVTFDGKAMYPVQIFASSPNIDSAILFNNQLSKLITSVKLANSDKAQIGDIVSVISSPEGWHDTATVGRISNVHQYLGQDNKPAWNDIIFIDADILEGSSGGMVIGTDGLIYGSVMGVTGQKADIGIGERAICPSSKILQLLQSIQK